MNRLLQVGLLFISLMVGIQGQDPSTPPISLRGSQNSIHTSSWKPLTCRFNLKSGKRKGTFLKPATYWDGWYVLSIDPKMGISCAELKKEICEPLTSWWFHCGNSWYTTNTDLTPITRKSFQGGTVCGVGERLNQNKQSMNKVVVNRVDEMGKALNYLADRLGWTGDAREWDEIPCSSAKFELPPWAENLIIAVSVLIGFPLTLTIIDFMRFDGKYTKRYLKEFASKVRDFFRSLCLIGLDES